MLGFSQYSQVSYTSIIEQKIRLFLLASFSLSPRLAGLMQEVLKGSETLQYSIVDPLFELFVKNLKDKNVYEEYLIPSVFIENVKYDFITNEESKTLDLAEQNLKNTFFRVIKEVLDEEGVVPNQKDETSSAFLTALLKLNKIRIVPGFSKSNFILSPTIVEYDQLFQETPSNDKSLFYLEKFYRIRKDVTEKLTLNEIKRAQFLGIGDRNLFFEEMKKESKLSGQIEDNFVQGIRLMFNLTSLIDIDFSVIPAKVEISDKLPAYNKSSLQILPFLDISLLSKLSDICTFIGKDRNYYKLQLSNATKKVFIKEFEYQTISVTPEQVEQSVEKVIKSAQEKASDKDSFIYSKSLICAEYGGTPSGVSVYFPIIMSEFVSENYNNSDVTLATGLSNTTTFNEIFVARNVMELIQIVKIVDEFFTVNPIDFFDASANSSIKTQYESLDNMIINLINFDEV